MGNPFLDRLDRTANLTHSHRRSKKQERDLSKRVGGKLTPASGSREVKGDVRVKGQVRIEAKTTKHASFSVTLDMVRKLEDAATLSDEMPVIVIEFINELGKPIAELAVMPTYVLDGLCEKKK